ncbi:MAG TPA: hypothetical protein DCO75_05660 [Fibrobacteres bacterium]|nr:hypothetical protein [Fibrobacterota bacterium]
MSESEDKLSILDLLIVIAEKKVLFIISMLFFCAAGIFFSLYMTKYYVATTVIMQPAQKVSSSLSSLIGKDHSSASLLKSMDLLGANNSDQFLSILNSRRLQEKIINRFNLFHYYGFDKRKKYFIEDILRTISRSIMITTDKYDNITVSVTDTSPSMAAAISNYMVQQLDSISFDLSKENAQYSRMFFDERLKIVKEDLDSATRVFTNYQIQHNYINLDQQVKSSIEAIAELEAKKMTVEMDIENLKNRFGPENQQLHELQENRQVMENQLKHYMNNGGGDLLVSLKNSPTAAATYAEYFRNVKMQETLYEFVIQMVEQAKFMEANNTPAVQVLEWAKVPEKRARPKRAIICFFFFVTGLAVTTTGILIIKWGENQKMGQTTTYKKLVHLFSLLLFKK